MEIGLRVNKEMGDERWDSRRRDRDGVINNGKGITRAATEDEGEGKPKPKRENEERKERETNRPSELSIEDGKGSKRTESVLFYQLPAASGTTKLNIPAFSCSNASQI